MKKTKKKLKYDIVLDAMLVLWFLFLNIEASLNGFSNTLEAFWVGLGMVVAIYMLYLDVKIYKAFRE